MDDSGQGADRDPRAALLVGREDGQSTPSWGHLEVEVNQKVATLAMPREAKGAALSGLSVP